MTDPDIPAIRERAEAAQNMISALCTPKGSEGARDWIMSIPARPDHDPDIVISASLADIRPLLALVDKQAAEIKRLREDWLKLENMRLQSKI
jgi:hypothetical protein